MHCGAICKAFSSERAFLFALNIVVVAVPPCVTYPPKHLKKGDFANAEHSERTNTPYMFVRSEINY